MKFTSEITGALSGAEKFFKSDKAKAALTEAVSISEKAVPIVQAIDTLVPNGVGPELVAAYEKYGVPFTDALTANPNLAKLQLATAVVIKSLPAGSATTALNVIQTGVQLAVTALHADPLTPTSSPAPASPARK